MSRLWTRWRGLRLRRAVFWHLGPDRLVAARLSRGEREPLLESCAASYAPPLPPSTFAGGVLEMAWVLGAEGDVHVAALSSSLCRLEEAGIEDPAAAEPDPPPETGERHCEARVRGAEGLRVRAGEPVVLEAAAMFRRAGLGLLALDCEDCAVESLARVLGSPDQGLARRQHLSAVSVAPASMESAEALGEHLAVPVGLAVAWLGSGHAQ